MGNKTEEKLIWTVLDAPIIQPNNWDFFWDAWNKHAGASYIDKSDPAGNQDSQYIATGKRTEFFKGLNIYATDPSKLEDGHWKLPYLNYMEIFPNVLDDLHAAFPWAEIEMCRLWMSNMPIPWHRDHTREAGALRAMIYNENTKPTFKVFHPNGGMHFVDLPEDSNTFIYNNSTCFHGSDREEGVNKIILLTIHRIKDRDLLNDHLSKSAEKYPNRCKYLTY
jgi:hypothetical protein